MRIHGHFNVCRLTYDAEVMIEDATLSKVFELSIGQVSNHNSGFRHQVLKKGTGAIRSLTDSLVMTIIPNITQTVISIGFIFHLNAYLGLITMVGVVCFVMTSVVINNSLFPEIEAVNAEENRIGTFFWEIMRHLKLVMINHQEKRMVDEYIQKSAGNCERGKRVWSTYFNYVAFVRQPLCSVVIFFVLCTAINLVNQGVLKPMDVFTTMVWAMAAFGALDSVGSMQRRLIRESIQVVKYFDLLDIPPAVTMVANPTRIKAVTSEIQFRDVAFEYPKFSSGKKEDGSDETEDEQSVAVSGISFTIKAGTTCAFVGPSGAGKTTIINLLTRAYDPQKGCILIDGHDLRDLDLSDVRKTVGYVEQDPKLWDETLQYNMLYCINGKANAVTEEQLDDLARRTRIDEFYPRLGKKKFQTKIGENGVQLSGGQRQRVAIARAIAKDPSVLILDEATNALDPANERLIHESMREALKGRTGIIIAHRLSTIRHADQIIVFKKGGIVGNGNHDELMKTCPTYASLVKSELEALLG